MSVHTTCHWVGGHGEEVVVVPVVRTVAMGSMTVNSETFVKCSLRGVTYRKGAGGREFAGADEVVWLVKDLEAAAEIALGLLAEVRRLQGLTVEGEALPEGGA